AARGRAGLAATASSTNRPAIDPNPYGRRTRSAGGPLSSPVRPWSAQALSWLGTAQARRPGHYNLITRRGWRIAAITRWRPTIVPAITRRRIIAWRWRRCRRGAGHGSDAAADRRAQRRAGSAAGRRTDRRAGRGTEQAAP